MEKIRTRFAPSPTGYLHIGGLRTALFSYLWAKKNKGEFIIRIEDTDRERYIANADQELIDTLAKVGIVSDVEVKHQSDRLSLYQKASDKLINNNQAYKCFCSPERLDKVREEQQKNKQVPKYDRHCLNLSKEEIDKNIQAGQKFVVRFKIPDDEIIVGQDAVYGKISIKGQDLDDFVILKSNKFPTYHLANVVDDHDMRISHVIRGEEWMPSFPKHILIYKALKYNLPTFVHLPLLLNPDKSKLSKRQGDVAVEDYLKKGYLIESLINYVALLGWNPGNDQEFFMINELIKEFSLEKINKAGAVFDITKLNWFNAEYIRKIIEQNDKRFEQLISNTEKFLGKNAHKAKKVLRLFGSRIDNLADLGEDSKFLFDLPEYDKEMLIFKKSDFEKTKEGINLALGILGKIHHSEWDQDTINNSIKDIIAKRNLSPGDIFWPLRVACSGLERSPSPGELLEFLGKEEALSRVKKAIKKLS
ncbi:MAG: glutamate--tRNA ligase [Candidatus Komeilibacteria bacterium]|jgi:glutamyl-tRNA synthetase|nr:glutamate--tRNA ligase [Candidatus Komeilibacteria bacterium]MBT4447654.1 glutamate--tRNA ligase [Candidatus Komeilibacteria bacterium]